MQPYVEAAISKAAKEICSELRTLTYMVWGLAMVVAVVGGCAVAGM